MRRKCASGYLFFCFLPILQCFLQKRLYKRIAKTYYITIASGFMLWQSAFSKRKSSFADGRCIKNRDKKVRMGQAAHSAADVCLAIDRLEYAQCSMDCTPHIKKEGSYYA